MTPAPAHVQNGIILLVIPMTRFLCLHVHQAAVNIIAIVCIHPPAVLAITMHIVLALVAAMLAPINPVILQATVTLFVQYFHLFSQQLLQSSLFLMNSKKPTGERNIFIYSVKKCVYFFH